ncbi:MAG TPA: bacterioferritin [Thermoanaerobaculia bacterium]|nr:bacterioferritin [Thermoanaerobaculia bacterium]
MKGNAKVIEILNDVLCAELTAVNQYFVHAMMCANWRYKTLAEHGRHESTDEMKHAQSLIERILYLEGIPNMQKYLKIKVGPTVPEQHAFDLDVERAAVARLNTGLEICRQKGDNGTRILLESILKEEEEHIDWLEAQLQQIADVRLPNYLALQAEG